MDRSKKIIFISHCILNQNAVVYPLARANGPYVQIIKKIMDNGIGIHQMPCPEYIELGLKRQPMNKDKYNTYEYRNLCSSLAKNTLNILKEYITNDYQIIGILGINQSPTCSIMDVKGIFMEELFLLTKENNIDLRKLDVPTDYMEDNNNDKFLLELEKFISI